MIRPFYEEDITFKINRSKKMSEIFTHLFILSYDSYVI